MQICLAQENKAFCRFREVNLHNELTLNWHSHLSAIKATRWSPWCWAKFLYDCSDYFQNPFLSFKVYHPCLSSLRLYCMVEGRWLIIQNWQYCKLQQILLEEQKHVKQFVCAFLLFSLTSSVNHTQVIKMKFLKPTVLFKSSGIEKSEYQNFVTDRTKLRYCTE